MFDKVAYVDNRGHNCPYCDSETLSTGQFDTETFKMPVTCYDCKLTWVEIYRLITIEEGE